MTSIKNNRFIEKILKNRFQISIILIILIGCFFRIAYIDKIPEGLNPDEASSGYEAYAIGNYGIDRNGNFLPIFLVSWGSGQNALYSYMLIPFIKIFGLSVFTTRLPMAILGCIALLVMYKLLKLIGNKKMIIVGMLFFVICPWHIMKSRWGLESNILPELILFSIYFLELFLEKQKKYALYLAFIILGLSSYAYGTAYFFLPIFVLFALVYLLRNKKIKVFEAIVCLAIVGTISLPIIICLIINTFDLPQMNLPFMTIPRMQENRYEQISSIFSGNVIQNSITNFISSIKILILQYDEMPWNAIKFFGVTYIFTIPFMIIGIIRGFEKKESKFMNIWFIVAVLLLFVCIPNINRCNIIIFPMIYYTLLGIYETIEKIDRKSVTLVIAAIYMVSFVAFINTYIQRDFTKDIKIMDNNELQEVVSYLNKSDAEQIFIEYSFKEPYIYFLFYSKENPNKFKDTVKYFREYGFENIKSYGKYYFYLPENEENLKNFAILKRKEGLTKKEQEEFEIKEFDNYVIIEERKE